MKLQISLTKIQSIEDTKTFFKELTDFFGLGWHPENDFNDYRKDDIPFDEIEANRLNNLMEQAFDTLEEQQFWNLAWESTKILRHEMGIGVDYEVEVEV